MSDPKENIKPLIQLTPEGKAQLEALDPDIKRAEKTLALMKEMDLDTTLIEAELNKHKKIREILLREFTG